MIASEHRWGPQEHRFPLFQYFILALDGVQILGQRIPNALHRLFFRCTPASGYLIKPSSRPWPRLTLNPHPATWGADLFEGMRYLSARSSSARRIAARKHSAWNRFRQPIGVCQAWMTAFRLPDHLVLFDRRSVSPGCDGCPARSPPPFVGAACLRRLVFRQFNRFRFGYGTLRNSRTFRPSGWLRGNEFAWFIPKFPATSNGACLDACLTRRFYWRLVFRQFNRFCFGYGTLRNSRTFRLSGWLRGNEFAWFIPKFLATSNGACLDACLRRRF